MHQRSLAANPQFADLTPVVGPDGDAFFETDFTSFQVPPCKQCEGILKPDVVYFGDNVPRDLASLRLQTPIIDTLDAVNQQLSAIT